MASQQVARLEALIQQCTGLKSVSVDGQAVTYENLLDQYNYWKSRQARENGTRPRVAQIDLGGYR